MCMSRDVLVKHCLFAATAAAVHNNKVATLYYTTLMRNEESSFFFFLASRLVRSKFFYHGFSIPLFDCIDLIVFFFFLWFFSPIFFFPLPNSLFSLLFPRFGLVCITRSLPT